MFVGLVKVVFRFGLILFVCGPGHGFIFFVLLEHELGSINFVFVWG